ncbi:hypothetical protein C8R44DRAFT_651090, partial [Mycena epipterygia]
PYVTAFVCLSLVFMATIYVTVKSSRSYHLILLLQVIQLDGIMYFMVLFSSNLAWVLLLIYAPVSLIVHIIPFLIIISA